MENDKKKKVLNWNTSYRISVEVHVRLILEALSKQYMEEQTSIIRRNSESLFRVAQKELRIVYSTFRFILLTSKLTQFTDFSLYFRQGKGEVKHFMIIIMEILCYEWSMHSLENNQKLIRYLQVRISFKLHLDRLFAEVI